MPELPDVETYRRRLARKGLRRRIQAASVHDAGRMLRIPAARLRRTLTGHSLLETRRHGKWLLARLSGDAGWLALHFGMTGDLAFFARGEEAPRHARLVLRFSKSEGLAFTSARKLGAFDLIDDPNAFVEQKRLGPDALAIPRAAFLEALDGGRGDAKGALMDQKRVAGIGNVWADEILYHARLHPRTPLANLDDKDIARLHATMRRVLREAVKRGARAEDMPRTWLLPHREEDAPCPRRCGGRIRKAQLRGRPTYWCPHCQKQP